MLLYLHLFRQSVWCPPKTKCSEIRFLSLASVLYHEVQQDWVYGRKAESETRTVVVYFFSTFCCTQDELDVSQTNLDLPGYTLPGPSFISRSIITGAHKTNLIKTRSLCIFSLIEVLSG